MESVDSELKQSAKDTETAIIVSRLLESISPLRLSIYRGNQTL